MNEGYRWFRLNEFVRKRVTTNAYFSTLTGRFKVVLKPTSEDVDSEDYTHVKDTRARNA
jgi:hypothetical protein